VHGVSVDEELAGRPRDAVIVLEVEGQRGLQVVGEAVDRARPDTCGPVAVVAQERVVGLDAGVAVKDARAAKAAPEPERPPRLAM